MIRSASKVRFAPRGAPAPAVPASRIATQARLSIADRPRLIAIGSSTGGVACRSCCRIFRWIARPR
jgi:two-component system chemotaxis response regulator CheB